MLQSEVTFGFHRLNCIFKMYPKKNKKAAKLRRTATAPPTKRLRHNEKEKRSKKIFFLFHPSGLIPFPFGFFACPPWLNGFLFFCFLFWKIILGGKKHFLVRYVPSRSANYKKGKMLLRFYSFMLLKLYTLIPKHLYIIYFFYLSIKCYVAVCYTIWRS